MTFCFSLFLSLAVEEVEQCLSMAVQSSVQGPLPVAEKYHKTVHQLLGQYTFDPFTRTRLELRQVASPHAFAFTSMCECL